MTIDATEHSLQERELLFRTLAESSPTGVFQVAPDGTPVYANQRVLQWFGMDMDAFRRREWLARVHPDDLRAVETAGLHSRGDGGTYDVEYRIVVDGHTRWLRVRTERVYDGTGATLLGYVGSVLDTSAERFAAEERNTLQAKLQQARRLESLGLLAGGIAHDFNNLLVGILANASMTRDELPPFTPAREALDDIAHAAQRAADLTQQLLAYAGRARVERRQVNITALVHDIPRMLGSRIPAHITCAVTGDVEITVDGDDTQLRQVLVSLVMNAVDAIGDAPGGIYLATQTAFVSADELARCLPGRARDAGIYAHITVRDTGAGMSGDVQEHMFDPFFTTRGQGRGLGLAATLGILNGHGGAIQVASEQGAGTVMRLLLPVSLRHATPANVRALNDGALTGTGPILLVDDDAGARSAARRILSRAGYTVHEAVNGEDAMARFAALPAPPRCVVLDLSMPVMSGDECLRQLRAEGNEVPVLMSSGYDADDIAGHLVQPGSVHFLQKPYTASDLLRAVRDLVDQAT